MADFSAIFRRLPRVETQRLILRPLEMADAEAVFAYAKDPEVARYLSWQPHRSIDDARQFISRTLSRYAQGQPASWGLEHKADGRLIGTAGFVNFLPRVSSAEIGYVLSPAYWGQGFASEAVREIIRFGLAELGLERIEARCRVENLASQRLLDRCGMSFERVVEPGPLLAGQMEPFRLYSVARANVKKRL